LTWQKKNSRGDIERAKKVMTQALGEYEQMGMRFWVDKCREALADLDSGKQSGLGYTPESSLKMKDTKCWPDT
jgi:hypothetical protein